MRESGRSGSGRCTASPVPFTRSARTRRRRPGAAGTTRAFLARRADAAAGADLLAELRRPVVAGRGGERFPAWLGEQRGGEQRGASAGPGRGRDGERGGALAGMRRRSAATADAVSPCRAPAAVPAEALAVQADRPAGWTPGAMPGRRPVRLTRRGRLVVLGLVLLLGAFMGFLGASPGRAADPPGPAVTAVVQPDDTLWSFAERNLPRWHTIAAVAELRRLNHLEGSVIHPGQRLILPSRS